MRNGQGTETVRAEDGYESTYTGEWVNNKKNGQGTATSFGGQLTGTLIYTGSWKDDEMHGQGKRSFVRASGTGYDTGDYINGKENGIFINTYEDGSTENIVYKDGVQVP